MLRYLYELYFPCKVWTSFVSCGRFCERPQSLAHYADVVQIYAHKAAQRHHISNIRDCVVAK